MPLDLVVKNALNSRSHILGGDPHAAIRHIYGPGLALRSSKPQP
jgi:hypothetical protein